MDYLKLKPEDFFNLIPTNVQENIRFRLDFHRLLAGSKGLQQWYLESCRQYLPIMFNSAFWTLNPRKSSAESLSPFILRPKQIIAVNKLDYCIKVGKDVAIDKDRDEGATEIASKTYTGHCILYKNRNFIVGSRKKELVDKVGDDYTVFAKIDNVFQYLPSWFGLSEEAETLYRKDMLIRVMPTGSAISGETTNESFSAGGRATSMLLDEFGRVPKAVAESIEGTIHPVTECVIYNSTHWLGPGHTFNRIIKSDNVEVITLDWFDNPEKNMGLYESPEPGLIRILDEEYYKQYNLPKKFKLADYEDMLEESGITFVADGGKELPPDAERKVRSPWHDKYQAEHGKRDWLCNVWRTPYGSADAVFDQTVLDEIKRKTIREPDLVGEVAFDCNSSGKIDFETVKFWPNLGARRLKLWGKFPKGRPPQNHNYILSADISWGLGSSNSVLEGYDVNTQEQILEWADPNTEPKDFADLAVAIAYWMGGVAKTFLIWEANGGQGTNFGKRALWQGHYHSYLLTKENDKTRKRGKKYGWRSNTQTRSDLLEELGIALTEGLKEKRTYVSIIIHSSDLLDELGDYIFSEKGKEAQASSKADLGTGARERHGDRVIAAGLCVLGTRDQPIGDVKNIVKPPPNSFMARYREKMAEMEKAKAGAKRYLYGIFL